MTDTGVVVALRALVHKLELIGASGSFVSVFSIAETHGGRYQGPQWTDELRIAKVALAELDGKQ